MTTRKFNFSPGPAVLPLEVLEIVRDNTIDFQGSGIGILEISHRSKQFEAVIKGAEADLRELLSITSDYSIIFLGGGATMQFSMVPMNLLSPGAEANYILSGHWSLAAHKEAKKFGPTHVVATTEAERFCKLPEGFSFSKNPAYVHFTSNNTIYGTQWKSEPEVGSLPLVCDASSDFLHKKVDVSKYGLIYAGAQKNLGPAGVTLVIVRNDLLSRSAAELPIYLNYNTHVKNQSLYNTPPVYAIYVVAEVLKWIKRAGGLKVIAERNQRKAAMLYAAIDATDFYQGTACPEARSLMNITFRIKNTELESVFVEEAAKQGLVELKGHRNVGGLRASIYNAFPEQGVAELVRFIRDFAGKHAA